MAKHILIVDDDPHICEVIVFALEKANMQTSYAYNGKQGLELFNKITPDFIVLDISMPEMDGLELCKEIRKTSDVPILFLSSRDDEIDRIVGLEIGADDYVTKPFSPRELVARVNTILKRTQSKALELATEEQINYGNLSLWPKAAKVELNNLVVKLTSKEYAILLAMVKAPNTLFDRNAILNHAYPNNVYVSDRTIDSHIRNVRAKFSKYGCNDVINTMHGMGYKLGSCK